MKKSFGIFLVFIVLLSTAMSVTSCGKTNQLQSSAEAILTDYNSNTTSYVLNGSFVEEGGVKLYYVTMRTSTQAYESIDNAASNSQYPDMTKQLLLTSLATSMKETAVKVYDSLTEVFEGTEIVCAVSILDDTDNPIATYDDRGWDNQAD